MRLFAFQEVDLILGADQGMCEKLKGQEFYGLSNLPLGLQKPWKNGYVFPKVVSQGRIIASPVAFMAHVFNTISYVHPDAPALSVAAHLFDNVSLHSKVREKGGAYGGGAVCSTLSGSFYFYSYRDPQICGTLKAFEESIQEIVSGGFENSDLEEAKLEVLQGLDSPIAPGSRTECAYGWMREGKTYEVRQAFRARLLSLSSRDIIEAVERHIIPNSKEGITVVFASREMLEKENGLLMDQQRSPLPTEGI